MPLKYVEGNILEAKTQVIVNTVNCKGVMGKGLALQFKKQYPDMFEEYKQLCNEGKITVGKLHLYKGSSRYWILNFPTKDDWRKKSKIEYLEKGLQEFRTSYANWKISSIAFPRLGCQLGGLDWNQVKPLMEKYLSDLSEIDIEIFQRQQISEQRKSYKTKKKRVATKDRNQKTLF